MAREITVQVRCDPADIKDSFEKVAMKAVAAHYGVPGSLLVNPPWSRDTWEARQAAARYRGYFAAINRFRSRVQARFFMSLHTEEMEQNVRDLFEAPLHMIERRQHLFTYMWRG